MTDIDAPRSLRIITPSYAPDASLFERLHDSVVQHTDASVVHEVIVPRRDVDLFRSIRSSRLVVTDVREFLPSGFVPITGVSRTLGRITCIPAVAKIQQIDIRRPWPPVRGWILQQVVKLAAAARSSESVVISLDSDLELIGRLTAADFLRGDCVRLFSDPGGVTPDMSDHVAWHATARSLLALPAAHPPPLTDHISGMVSWDPRLVRAMLDHVSDVKGRPWIRCVTSCMQFSEDILYGTYVLELAAEESRRFLSADSRCASHWDPTAMTEQDAREFLSAVRPTDVAVQVQSTSSTPDHVRRSLIDAAASKVRA